MKQRVKTDNAILSFVIILTAFLLFFPHLYPADILWDDILDFVGIIVVLSGIYLRMVARGYKKANSDLGGRLVVSGPYQLIRNPMYLGSFLMGSGFILIVWPWWALPLFAALFYLRFNRQIKKEEVFLNQHFGRHYTVYCEQVPRLFPTLRNIRGFSLREVFPLETAWSTKEKRGLIGWPAAACLLEMLQERVVFGFADFHKTSIIFLMGMTAFALTLIIAYQKNK